MYINVRIYRCQTKTDVTKFSPTHSRYYLLRSTFLTKLGPEISCVFVLNASGMTEVVTGLVNWDMQRYVMFYFLWFLSCMDEMASLI